MIMLFLCEFVTDLVGAFLRPRSRFHIQHGALRPSVAVIDQFMSLARSSLLSKLVRFSPENHATSIDIRRERPAQLVSPFFAFWRVYGLMTRRRP